MSARRVAAKRPSRRADARARLAAHHALSASRRAESRYVLDVTAILAQVHAGALTVVRREHLGGQDDPHEDEEGTPGPRGLGPDFLRRMMRFVEPSTRKAFDRMAGEVDKGNARGAELVGIKPREVPELAKVIDEARAQNVALVRNASADFLAEVRQVLVDHEGMVAGRGSAKPEARAPRDLATALQQRVGVSRSRGVLIARDQTLKLNGAINKHRQTAAGVTRFRWVTSHDERVRPSHAELEGKSFSWDDDARAEEMSDYAISDDDPGDDAPTPGGPINCRCTASPIIEEGEEEEGEGEGEDEPDDEPPSNEIEKEEEPEEVEAEIVPAEPRSGILTRDMFARVHEDPGAAFSAEQVVAGLEHEGIAAWLDESEENRPHLFVGPSVIDPAADPDTEGIYRPNIRRRTTPELHVAANAPRAILRERGRAWGDTWRVADRRSAISHREQIESSFIHEFGHHLHMGPAGFSDPSVDAAVQDAFARVGLNDSRFAQRVLSGEDPSPAISRYAAKNSKEYFAESFNAYITDREDLRRHDPTGHRMVALVLKKLRIEE